MSVDYQRLFNEGRLHPIEHKIEIASRLAALQVTDPSVYLEFKALYDKKCCGECKKCEKEPVKEEPQEVVEGEELVEVELDEELTTEEMKQVLEDSGVKVDGRWSKKKIAEKYNELLSLSE